MGWAVGRNVRIDYRWGAGDADRIRRYAAELVALAPDVILATGATAVAPLLQATRTRADRVRDRSPIRSAPASSIAWRGRAATPPASSTFEYGLSGKWLELLKQIAPGVTRAAVLRDPAVSAGIGQFGAIQAVAPSLGVRGEPGQRARRRRDRARRRGLRARLEWRADRDGERVGDAFIAI